jgi:hypothetical protein
MRTSPIFFFFLRKRGANGRHEKRQLHMTFSTHPPTHQSVSLILHKDVTVDWTHHQEKEEEEEGGGGW